MKVLTRVSAKSIAVMFLLMLSVACGQGAEESRAEADATATAERRAQAIAEITTVAATVAAGGQLEPLTAQSTATPTPTVAVEDGHVRGPGRSTGDEVYDINRPVLESLLVIRSIAMSTGNFDAWYETCAPAVRENAIRNDLLGRQMRALNIEPSETAQFEFVLEDIYFTGSTAATVTWGIRDGAGYYPGIGGGQYIKETGRWYSVGWGCTG